jgi:predicted ribosome-associated RNA-binding protein Tma20
MEFGKQGNENNMYHPGFFQMKEEKKFWERVNKQINEQTKTQEKVHPIHKDEKKNKLIYTNGKP